MADTETKTSGLGATLQRADEAAFRFCFWRIRNPVFDVLMPALSRVADRGVLWFSAAALMIAMDRPLFNGPFIAPALAMLAGVGLGGLVTEWTIKLVWKRKRPFAALEGVAPRVSGKRFYKRPSFPSGHSAGYFAGATVLSHYFPVLAPAFYTAAALGAFSRAYCGVHYPSDVVAGSAIGVGAGWIVVLLFKMFV